MSNLSKQMKEALLQGKEGNSEKALNRNSEIVLFVLVWHLKI